MSSSSAGIGGSPVWPRGPTAPTGSSCPLQTRCGSHRPFTHAAVLTCDPSAHQPCWEPPMLRERWPIPATCLQSPSHPGGAPWAGRRLVSNSPFLWLVGRGGTNTCMGDLHNNPGGDQTSAGQVLLLAHCWEPTPAQGHTAPASSPVPPRVPAPNTCCGCAGAGVSPAAAVV